MPLPFLTSITSVTHSSVVVVSLSASTSNRLTVTLYVHFAPFASGSGSAAIISCSVSWCFLGGLLHAPRTAAAHARRVGRFMDSDHSTLAWRTASMLDHGACGSSAGPP